MASFLEPKDPIAVARGKIFQKRFKPPEGISGFVGSFVRSIVDWRESKSTLTHEQYISEQIEKEMRPSPIPSPVPLDVKAQEKSLARRRLRTRRRGRAGTILTGGGGLGGRGSTLLGGGA